MSAMDAGDDHAVGINQGEQQATQSSELNFDAANQSNPDEPIASDNGVNYDVYESENAKPKGSDEELEFSSERKAEEKPIEYFTNVAGAEKRKRKAERLEKRREKARLKAALKKSKREKRSSDDTSETKRIALRIKVGNFLKRNIKKILIIVLVGVIIAAVSIIVVKNTTEKQAELEKTEYLSNNIGKQFLDIQEIRANNSLNSEEYYNAMQKLIDDAKFDELKARWLLERAKDLLSTEEDNLIKKALDDAYASDRLNSTLDSLYTISIIEEKLGHKDKAAEYTKKYKAESEKQTNESGGGEG